MRERSPSGVNLLPALRFFIIIFDHGPGLSRRVLPVPLIPVGAGYADLPSVLQDQGSDFES